MKGEPVRPGWGLTIVAAILSVVVALAGVVAHDAVAAFVGFDPGLLCQRGDGSLWRDPSFGCTDDDPKCWPNQCAPSQPVAEGWRHACVWWFFAAEARPTGDPAPRVRGEAPGAGCEGRE